MKLFSALFVFIFFTLFFSCSSDRQVKYEISGSGINSQEEADRLRKKDLNFKFTGYDINIDDPALDRRSYLKVYIDKLEAGRTTIGLESQMKSFETKVATNNRHLIKIEKWVLDEKKGEYVKLNNISQPKPDYVYFNLPSGKDVEIILKNDPVANKSEFEVKID